VTLEAVALATRRLYDSVCNSPLHCPFIRAVDASPRKPRTVIPGTVIAIAPAALYKEYRRSGADGRRIREAAVELGLPVETIPLEPMGGVRRTRPFFSTGCATLFTRMSSSFRSARAARR
jgi:hypothetical protein